jgi:hypothetical protein
MVGCAGLAVDQLPARVDGVGGADPAGGSGFRGLPDRVEALGGSLEVVSPAGGGRPCGPRSRARDPRRERPNGTVVSGPPSYRISSGVAGGSNRRSDASPRHR